MTEYDLYTEARNNAYDYLMCNNNDEFKKKCINDLKSKFPDVDEKILIDTLEFLIQQCSDEMYNLNRRSFECSVCRNLILEYQYENFDELYAKRVCQDCLRKTV